MTTSTIKADGPDFDPLDQPINTGFVKTTWGPKDKEDLDKIKSNTWNGRLIQLLDKADAKIEAILPNFKIQTKLDNAADRIKEFFSPLTKFNNWIDRSNNGKWYAEIGLFLTKLPLKVARNILRLVYNLIEAALFTTVHPLKALNKFVKCLVNLIHALTKPETWLKIGASVVGASIGNALISGNPFSLIALAIGGAMIYAGLAFSVVKAAIAAKRGERMDAVGLELLLQIKEIPESLLTGFAMGLMMGYLQKTIQEHQHSTFKVVDQKTAQEWANKFENHYSKPSYVHLNNDKVWIEWRYHPHLGNLQPGGSPWSGYFVTSDPKYAVLFESVPVTNYGGLVASTIGERVRTPFYSANKEYVWNVVEPDAI
jgi:hypothetical protein